MGRRIRPADNNLDLAFVIQMGVTLQQEQKMEKCSKCGADAELHENANPTCPKCSQGIEAARKQTAEVMKERHPNEDL